MPKLSNGEVVAPDEEEDILVSVIVDVIYCY